MNAENSVSCEFWWADPIINWPSLQNLQSIIGEWLQIVCKNLNLAVKVMSFTVLPQVSYVAYETAFTQQQHLG